MFWNYVKLVGSKTCPYYLHSITDPSIINLGTDLKLKSETIVQELGQASIKDQQIWKDIKYHSDVILATIIVITLSLINSDQVFSEQFEFYVPNGR